MDTDHNHIIYNSKLQISSDLVQIERKQETLTTWASHLKAHVETVTSMTEKLQEKYYTGEFSDKVKLQRTKYYALEQGALLEQIQHRITQLKYAS